MYTPAPFDGPAPSHVGRSAIDGDGSSWSPSVAAPRLIPAVSPSQQLHRRGSSISETKPEVLSSSAMSDTAITDAMRDKALTTAAQIIHFAQTTALGDPGGGHDLSLTLLRRADPLAYREMLDVVTLLEAQGLARRWQHGLCTVYAARR
jgi:hypothetical protein